MTEDDVLPDIIVQPAAEAEISDAFRWYQDRSEGLGSEFMRALEVSLSLIQRHPTSYAAVHKQMRRAVLRRFPYSVIYLFEERRIVVLACFHASRDPKQWQDRA